jgi:signal recognition particle subunit SRP72
LFRQNKRNHEAVLRRREKKRQDYLEKLQQEGKYNPDRPLKPDPERWLPKSQRSYNKRGRRGRSQFIGAQGIGSGAGADKDAAKLDAAARAAAKAQGIDLNGQTRSTAHLAVSSNGNTGKSGRRR